MDNSKQLEDAIVTSYLPDGSSRQVVRAELFRRVFANLSTKVSNSRTLRRSLARDLSKELYRRGERLLKPPAEPDTNLVTLT